jgi:hypothetical protein
LSEPPPLLLLLQAVRALTPANEANASAANRVTRMLSPFLSGDVRPSGGYRQGPGSRARIFYGFL